MTVMDCRVIEAPANTDEWHEARRGGIGSSDIPIILGLVPWSSRFQLWHQKAGLLGPSEPTEAMTVGTFAERAIGAWWASNHPEYDLAPAPGVYVHNEREWQRASPDFLARKWALPDPGVKPDPPVLIECKFSARSDGWGKSGTDDIPVGYRAQVLWQLDVLGLDEARVCVLFGGEARFAEYVVHADEADAAYMRDEARIFWLSIAAGERPDIDDRPATLDTVKALHPDIDRDQVASLDADDVAAMWAAGAHAKAADAALRAAQARVLDAMGDARIGLADGVARVRRQPTAHGKVALHRITTRKGSK